MEKAASLIEQVLPRLPRVAIAGLLVALTLIAVLPAFTRLPPVDRDEARFAQVSKQMVISRNPIDIRFQDEDHYKKPIGIYWLQAATVELIGDSVDRVIWHYRLPSLAAVIVAVLLTARIAMSFGGPLAGLWAGTMMSGVFLFIAEGHLATTDASLLASILAAQTPLARLYRDARAREFLRERITRLLPWEMVMFWGGLAASILLKGPVGPMVVLTTLLLLAIGHRRVRWLAQLRPLIGVAVLLVLVMPWFVAITIKSGSAFWDASVGHDLMGKVVGAQESHGAPPGSYLAGLWLTFFPASIALAIAIPALWRGRSLPGIVFAAAWIVPSWIVFEASPTKLIHYVLPLYPAFAVAVALVWPQVTAKAPRLWQWIVAGLIALLPIAVLVAIGVYALKLGMLPVLPVLPLLAGLALIVLGATLGVQALHHGHASGAVFAFWVMGTGFGASAFDTVSRVPELWPAPAITAYILPRKGCPAPPVVTDGYNEASLVFLAPGTKKAVDPEGVAAAMAADRCTVGVVSDTVAFLAAAAAKGIAPKALGQFKGLNLGTGKKIDLTVYRFPQD